MLVSAEYTSRVSQERFGEMQFEQASAHLNEPISVTDRERILRKTTRTLHYNFTSLREIHRMIIPGKSKNRAAAPRGDFGLLKTRKIIQSSSKLGPSLVAIAMVADDHTHTHTLLEGLRLAQAEFSGTPQTQKKRFCCRAALKGTLKKKEAAGTNFRTHKFVL